MVHRQTLTYIVAKFFINCVNTDVLLSGDDLARMTSMHVDIYQEACIVVVEQDYQDISVITAYYNPRVA